MPDEISAVITEVCGDKQEGKVQVYYMFAPPVKVYKVYKA